MKAVALSSDMLDLINLFIKDQVRFIVVGAHAVNTYTEARMTKDIDLWIEPTPLNAKLVFNCLVTFGAPLANTKVDDFCDLGSFFVIGVNPNRIDLLTSIPGLEFGSAWSNRKLVLLGDIELPVLSLEDVITAKTAAGRPQDLLDLKKLLLYKKKLKN